jgi:DNA-binding transcriptional LysR family regulator
VQLGFKLFNRQPGRKPHLSDAGAEFLEDVEAFELAARRLARHRRRDAEDTLKSMHILVGEVLLENFIRPKLADYLEQNPGISVEFETVAPIAKERPFDKKFDIVLTHFESHIEAPPGFKFLASTRSGIVGHPRFQADRQAAISLADLKEMPFIMPPRGSTAERSQHQILKSRGIIPGPIVANLQYRDMIVALAARGSGVAVLPEFLVPEADRCNIVMLFPLREWNLGLLVRNAGPNPELAALAQFLVQSVLGHPEYHSTCIYLDE